MIYIQETWVNKSKGYTIGESGVYETFTDKRGQLFRSLQKEYGKCTSSVYVDCKSGGTKRIGWVFEQTAHYEDTNEPYTRETWVTLHERKPETTIRTFPVSLDKA